MAISLLPADPDEVFIHHSDDNSFVVKNTTGAAIPAGSMLALNSTGVHDLAYTRDRAGINENVAFHFCVPRNIVQGKYADGLAIPIGERLTFDGGLQHFTASATGLWIAMPREIGMSEAPGIFDADGAALATDTHVFACRLLEPTA